MEIADFIEHVRSNYENFDKFRYEYDVLSVRNHAAENGVEMTPTEVENCFDLIIAVLEFIDEEELN